MVCAADELDWTGQVSIWCVLLVIGRDWNWTRQPNFRFVILMIISSGRHTFSAVQYSHVCILFPSIRLSIGVGLSYFGARFKKQWAYISLLSNGQYKCEWKYENATYQQIKGAPRSRTDCDRLKPWPYTRITILCHFFRARVSSNNAIKQNNRQKTLKIDFMWLRETWLILTQPVTFQLRARQIYFTVAEQECRSEPRISTGTRMSL